MTSLPAMLWSKVQSCNGGIGGMGFCHFGMMAWSAQGKCTHTLQDLPWSEMIWACRVASQRQKFQGSIWSWLYLDWDDRDVLMLWNLALHGVTVLLRSLDESHCFSSFCLTLMAYLDSRNVYPTRKDGILPRNDYGNSCTVAWSESRTMLCGFKSHAQAVLLLQLPDWAW